MPRHIHDASAMCSMCKSKNISILWKDIQNKIQEGKFETGKKKVQCSMY